jgi:hypothetical protein
MTHAIACFRCGASLAALSLPLSRRDECPECTASLHVCRMCRHFDPAAVNQWAKQSLEALFGDGKEAPAGAQVSALSEAEKLFRS